MTSEVKTVEKDTMVLYILSWPPELGDIGENKEVFVVPIMQRKDGILLAIPSGLLSPETMAQGNQAGENSLVGPNISMSLQGMEEDDFGLEVPLDLMLQLVLVDFNKSIISLLREFDPVTDSLLTRSFLEGSPQVMPMSSILLQKAYEWMLGDSAARLQFYSADEGGQTQTPSLMTPGAKAVPKKKVTTAVLAEQISALSQSLPMITEQLQALKDQQTKFETVLQTSQEALTTPAHRMNFPAGTGPNLPSPSISAFARGIGPSPRVKDVPKTLPTPVMPRGRIVEEPAVPPSEMEAELIPDGPHAFSAAILQQSQAMNALVAHLINQDPLSDLAGSSAQSSLSMRGATKRERLQNELASRSGNFFLQVAQLAFRRVRPTDPMPTKLEEFPKKAVFSKYLERQGGFSQHPDYGIMMWMMAQVGDAMINQDQRGAQELLALTMVTLEQANLDNAKWDLAFILSLQEDPPQTLFTSKTAVANPRLKAFAPLCPQAWATTALAYVKELDVITNRRADAAKPQKKGTGEGDEERPGPKRKPRFPKKPKQEDAK